MNVSLNYDDYMSMFQADVNDFFEAFNELIVKEYGF